ncbi:MAG: nickel pincer cofactor biosynthesis protein LarC [Myxococcota bacterium]
MSRVLYLEPVGGIAGDMFLAAAIDLGLAREELTAALAGLKLPGWRLDIGRAERHAIAGTHLNVVVDGAPNAHPHRTLFDIEAMIQAADTLSPKAKERALRVFRVIGEAEARIHDVPVEKIHFHEVGAVDSIVDICGAAVALELLGDPEVYSAPPPLGSGTVQAAHGHLPAPAPATLEILKGVPVRFEGVGELTTPTGAALVKALAKVGPPPELCVERIGYGVGTRDFPDRPNVLRASLGRTAQGADEGTFVIEANLDDCSPQLLGALLEKLLTQGAHDAWVLPATMKKSRPGHLLGAVVPGGRRAAVEETLLSESTTLGVRGHRVERTVLARRFEEVDTRFGKVHIKLALLGERVVNAQPEFEDCRVRAEAAKVPLKQVMAEALAAYWHR